MEESAFISTVANSAFPPRPDAPKARSDELHCRIGESLTITQQQLKATISEVYRLSGVVRPSVYEKAASTHKHASPVSGGTIARFHLFASPNQIQWPAVVRIQPRGLSVGLEQTVKVVLLWSGQQQP